MSLKILVFDDEKGVDRFVADQIIETIQSQKHANLGFATGNTPSGVYAQLIQDYQSGEIDFSSVNAFNLDEYAGIPSEHPCSFAHAMAKSLFRHINIPSECIFSLQGDASDLNKECERYEQLILKHPIDLQLLGIGMDGHIAYNEPGTSFDSLTHLVDLHQESIESSLDYGFSQIQDVPKVGMTQGIATIMRAKQLIMIAKGVKKASLVKQMLENEISENFPSTIIRRHKNVLVVLDKDAASHLKESYYERC